MLVLTKLCGRSSRVILTKVPNISTSYSSNTQPKENNDIEEFRVLHVRPKKEEVVEQKFVRAKVPPPRTNQMPTDQDWSSVWPGPRTFHPASVPFPIRQGFPMKNKATPGKFGNAELMKIPNFLHLTPPAVARHCEALKQFCTEWPAGLETDEKCDKHFPVEIITSDYCYSSPSIRDPLARIVSLRVKLSSLKLDAHAKDKLLRLLKDRYNPETDLITITADRCPMRKQNLDYAEYLLIAVYHESNRVEPWEAEKSLVDMEYYDWDRSESRKNVVGLHAWPSSPPNLDYEHIPHIEEYKTAVSSLLNEGEDEYSINKYKEAVKYMLNIRN